MQVEQGSADRLFCAIHLAVKLAGPVLKLMQRVPKTRSNDNRLQYLELGLVPADSQTRLAACPRFSSHESFAR